jgi:putative sugar O-methyltransferase
VPPERNASIKLRGYSELIAELADGPECYKPSPFWREMAGVGASQIEIAGFENFKRTINMTYFCWDLLGILRHQLLPVLGHWLARPDRRVFGARFENPDSGLANQRHYSPPNFRAKIPVITNFHSSLTAFAYRTYVAMLYENVAERDHLRLLSRIDEPELGNPFLISYRGCRTSQDLCNSVHEFYSMGGAEFHSDCRVNVAELGAGYGRLAYVWLKALPFAQYCLIDIAPALNIAQEYLGRLFPSEKIFYFRPFSRYEDIRDEFESARIRFLSANQIELLPPDEFDVFANISSLHEMGYEQITNYLRQIDRVCRGRFYSKQWLRSQASINGFTINASEYPIPDRWKAIYHSRHPIQGMFFHAFYETRPSVY